MMPAPRTTVFMIASQVSRFGATRISAALGDDGDWLNLDHQAWQEQTGDDGRAGRVVRAELPGPSLVEPLEVIQVADVDGGGDHVLQRATALLQDGANPPDCVSRLLADVVRGHDVVVRVERNLPGDVDEAVSNGRLRVRRYGGAELRGADGRDAGAGHEFSLCVLKDWSSDAAVRSGNDGVIYEPDEAGPVVNW